MLLCLSLIPESSVKAKFDHVSIARATAVDRRQAESTSVLTVSVSGTYATSARLTSKLVKTVPEHDWVEGKPRTPGLDT